MVPARLDPEDPTSKPFPNRHMCSHTHSYSVLLFGRQEECYRLTQRKSACRPVLTQGPSSLWPGQCPTVCLEAAAHSTGNNSQAQLYVLLFSFFCIQIPIFPLCCDFSPLPCLSSLSEFIHNTTFQLHLIYIHEFSNFIPLSVFKASGTLP